MNKSQKTRVWIIACLINLGPCTYKKIGGDVRILNREMMVLQKQGLVFKRASKPSVWESGYCMLSMKDKIILTTWQKIKLKWKMITNR